MTIQSESKAPARIAVVLNPKSGSIRESAEVEAAIRAALPGAEIMIGAAAGDAERAAADARGRGFDVLVAAGGDGTLNEVLNGALASPGPVTLGLLPLGTGNDFARSLALPLDLHQALAVIRAGAIRALDVVRVTGSRERLMMNISAGGFAGVVNDKITPEIKAAWGPLSYLRGFIEALGELQDYTATVSLDRGAPQEIKVLNIVVANAGYVARGIPIAPTADPADGLLDLVAIRVVPAGQLVLLAPRILAGAHLEHEDILHLRARHIAIQSEPSMTFNTDGETLGEGPIIFEVLPGAVAFLAPAEEGRP